MRDITDVRYLGQQNDAEEREARVLKARVLSWKARILGCLREPQEF